MNERNIILVVDDMEINRFVLSELFVDNYEIIEAENGAEAIDILAEKSRSIAAVLTDILMPIKDGFDILEYMNETGIITSIPVFLITANDSGDNMRRGYDLGAIDIIIKPIISYFVRQRVNNIINLYHAREQLSGTVKTQAEELLEQANELRKMNEKIIEALATAIEFRDCESGEHVLRIKEFTRGLLLKLREIGFEGCRDISDEQINQIAVASTMHDVGKISIPDGILNKPGRLTDEEFEIMKQHTVQGCELLDRIPNSEGNPIFDYAYDICRHHHEKWDGRGYPDGLKGEEISIWSQVVALADCYDALTTERCYKKAFSHETAVNMILGGECGQFNPALMEVFKSQQDEIRKTYLQFTK